MKQKLNILIADDHDYFLDGLQTDIENILKFNKIFRANNGYEVLEIIKNNPIDILISDINMPKLDGIKTAIILRKTNKSLKIIFLTGYYEIQYIKPLLKLDIKVILDKENIKNEIKQAINAILNNQTYYTKLIQTTVNDILKGRKKTSSKNIIPDLTKREKEIFSYLVKGLSNKEIAEKLLLSPQTIDSHRTNIYFKFEVNSATKLIVKAIEYGLIE